MAGVLVSCLGDLATREGVGVGAKLQVVRIVLLLLYERASVYKWYSGASMDRFPLLTDSPALFHHFLSALLETRPPATHASGSSPIASPPPGLREMLFVPTPVTISPSLHTPFGMNDATQDAYK